MFSVHFPCNTNYTFIEILLKMLIFMIISLNYIIISKNVFHFFKHVSQFISREGFHFFLVDFLSFYISVLNCVYMGFKE